MAIQISTDGGLTFVPAPNGVIVQHGVIGSDECNLDLHFSHNHDGLIIDTILPSGGVVGTEIHDLEDFINEEDR